MTNPIESGEAAPLDRSSYPQASARDVEVLLNKCRGRIESLYVFLDEGFLASAAPLSYLAVAYDVLEGAQVVLSGAVEDSPVASSLSKSFEAAERSLTKNREILRAARTARRRNRPNA